MTNLQPISLPPASRAADAGSDDGAEAPGATPQVRDPNLRNVLAEEAAYEQRAEEHLLLQRQRFDLANERRSELMREQDAIRDLLMADLKNEDAYLKKWIELI
ncbi:MAG TPA: hypothetical protein VMS32_10300 [Verrucomicrobiae bacterium]|jgi:hypothetical protein|nr:hypothetical protein [Verrucomicrobiae bacterium]